MLKTLNSTLKNVIIVFNKTFCKKKHLKYYPEAIPWSTVKEKNI